jgi:tetraacyldisaccharide 4'-kinase
MLLSSHDFHEIVSGRRRGWKAAAWRAAFAAAQWPYAAAVAWRNRQFDRGKREIRRVGVPVVSVGNITLGGVGKTPLVEWLARWFRERGVRVTLISRGYGAEAGARNDEALELEQKLPDVPHVQNPDRVEAAEMAIEEFECQLILLDDAFQHRRIHRDLDIVVLDALAPFGFDHLFPRGALREPLSGLRRAHVIALSRADLVSAEERASIRRRAQHYAPEAAWIEMRHRPRLLLSSDGREDNLDILQGASVAAFCGIGNPAAFRRTLESCGCRIPAFREFADHHAYTRADVESLSQWSSELREASLIVCTHKDLVKIGEPSLGPLALRALVIGIEILSGQEELESLLAEAASPSTSVAGR